MQHKTIKDNEHLVKHEEHDYQAFVPYNITKTQRDYFWLIPNKYNFVVMQIRKLVDTGYTKYEQLVDSMKPFYTNMVLKKAKGVLKKHNDKKWYSMRTARAYHATEWIKLVYEYRMMEWKPEPPNPLQHETEKTTKEHYAIRGITSNIAT